MKLAYTPENINHQDTQGQTLLIWAVKNNDLHAAVFAVDYAHADKAIKDNQGKTAHDYAIALNRDANDEVFREITSFRSPTVSPKPVGCLEKFVQQFIGRGH
jgi:ankyrin repeat protein